MMRRLCALGLCTFAFILPTFAVGACPPVPGDVNDSGVANVADVQCTILVALWELGGSIGPAPACILDQPGRADANCDGTVNVVDVQIIIQIVLGNPLDPVIDSNGDLCVDTCEPACGDGVCETPEDCTVCPIDCGACAGACCEASSLPGCAQPACESCVCGLDGFCCDTAWDELCVQLATAVCDECGCEPSPSCCSAHGGAGCEVPACEACVCQWAPYCCTTAWDPLCLSIAVAFCSTAVEQLTTATGDLLVPPVPSGFSAQFEMELVFGTVLFVALTHDLPDPVGAFLHFGGPGANGPPFADLGFADSPLFATVPLGPLEIDALLSGQAHLILTSTSQPSGALRADLQLSVGPGPCPCVSVLDCCEPHGFPNCGVPACQTCVCAEDAFCCAVAWDANCALLAAQGCGAACGCVGARPCCLPHPEPGCQAPNCEGCVCAADSFCCDAGWDIGCTNIAAGDCWPSCGCPPLASGSCCSAHPGAGCGEPSCETCVCAADSFCCSFGWDSSCALIASTSCLPSCSCPPAPTGPCCAPHSGVGCAIPACESCVCGAESWCCEVLWDEICVAQAAGPCAAPCGCP